MKKILICCINYNNAEEVLEYAKDISLQNLSEEVILAVTDNSTEIKEKLKLKNELKKIKLKTILLEPSANLGYLNGMFLAVKKYFELYKNYPEWTIFSNTDIKFIDNNFIEIFSKKDYPINYWCIAPSIFSPQTRSYQNPHYKNRIKLSNIDRVLFVTKYYLLFNIYTFLSKLKSKNNKKIEEESQEVYAAHGSFFILKKEYFESLKDINYRAFLYSEEAFIAETILEKNKKIFYDNSLKIIHNEHSTTGLIGNKNRARYINESLKYIKKEFYEREDEK